MLLGPDRTPHVSGGRLCLGIVNTVLWRRSDEPIERLVSYADLVSYVERAGWLESSDELLGLSAAHPRKARSSLNRALDLRERLFRLFSQVAAGGQPDPADLGLLNLCLGESLAEIEVQPTESGDFHARWRRCTSLDVPLWQVAASAGTLLTSAELAALKQCPGEQCGWVFLDESSNRSRRWCDSRLCGNRARVRAHYQRSRAS
jgi:predicted RNA-binding Zn ribbon-like protein